MPPSQLTSHTCPLLPSTLSPTLQDLARASGSAELGAQQVLCTIAQTGTPPLASGQSEETLCEMDPSRAAAAGMHTSADAAEYAAEQASCGRALGQERTQLLPVDARLCIVHPEHGCCVVTPCELVAVGGRGSARPTIVQVSCGWWHTTILLA